jgi:DNA-binding Lrp family transcriptional regulator
MEKTENRCVHVPDKIDLLILRELQENARLPNVELA